MALSRDQYRNNFDLLRLLASLQVIYFHLGLHLGVSFGGALEYPSVVLSFFPGVPVFFVISGFLVSASYERAGSLSKYARNRFLRIYPALWACFVASLVIVGAFGGLTATWVASRSFWLWLVAQLSFVQFYHPPELRWLGVGTLNGSLWTIPVELSFYVTLPVLYWLAQRTRRAGPSNVMLVTLALASYLVWCFTDSARPGHESVLVKLAHVSLAPHLHLFLLGTLLQRNFHRFRRAIEGKALIWTVVYVAAMATHRAVFGAETPQEIQWGASVATLALRVLLGFWILAFAFTARDVSMRALRGHDISYGLYIYHALALNIFVELGWSGSWLHVVGALALTIAAATFSWRAVELPALRRKWSNVPRTADASAS